LHGKLTRDFGWGSGHPAGLNFRDCFAYALEKTFRKPLLYPGDDFAHAGIAGSADLLNRL
jgi:ribonuclease VapC